jgi:hypothetical protein
MIALGSFLNSFDAPIENEREARMKRIGKDSDDEVDVFARIGGLRCGVAGQPFRVGHVPVRREIVDLALIFSGDAVEILNGAAQVVDIFRMGVGSFLFCGAGISGRGLLGTARTGEMQDSADGENNREKCAALLHLANPAPVF